MVETLSTLSIISFAVAGVCFVLAVFFWIFFKIPAVIGDLSGRTARKSIARMRAANEKTGTKTYKESKTNAARGKLTGFVPGSEKLEDNQPAASSEKPETGLLAENKADDFVSEATGLLNDEDATALLNPPPHSPAVRTGGKKLEIIEEVILIHTEEVIG